jgi:hypothetical protein
MKICPLSPLSENSLFFKGNRCMAIANSRYIDCQEALLCRKIKHKSFLLLLNAYTALESIQ